MSSSTTDLISLPEKVYERMITLHQIILSSVKEYFKENVQKEIEEFQKLFIREKFNLNFNLSLIDSSLSSSLENVKVNEKEETPDASELLVTEAEMENQNLENPEFDESHYETDEKSSKRHSDNDNLYPYQKKKFKTVKKNDDFMLRLKNSVSSILPKAAREKFEKEFKSFENHFIVEELISSSTSFEEMDVEKEVPFDDSKLLPVTGAEMIDDQETPENFEKSQDLAQRLSDGPVFSNTKPKTREKKKESFEDFLDRMKMNISGPADDDAVDPVLTATEIEKISTPDEMKKILKNISFGLSKNSMKSSYLVGKALSKYKLIFPECKSNKALVKLCDHIKITDASYAGFLMNFASCCDSYPKLLTIVNVSIKDIKNNFGNIQSCFRNSQYERSFWK